MAFLARIVTESSLSSLRPALSWGIVATVGALAGGFVVIRELKLNTYPGISVVFRLSLQAWYYIGVTIFSYVTGGALFFWLARYCPFPTSIGIAFSGILGIGVGYSAARLAREQMFALGRKEDPRHRGKGSFWREAAVRETRNAQRDAKAFWLLKMEREIREHMPDEWVSHQCGLHRVGGPDAYKLAEALSATIGQRRTAAYIKRERRRKRKRGGAFAADGELGKESRSRTRDVPRRGSVPGKGPW